MDQALSPTLKPRDGCGPTAQTTPHIVAKATVRDAIVALGAEYGFLLEPVEWRVAEYLRYEHLYAVGGYDGQSFLSTVECFDPSTNVWSPVASMTTARDGHGVTVLGGLLYAVGGFDGYARSTLSTVECFDPSTNVWSPVASMATARSGPGVTALGGLLYAFGGYDGTSILSTVECFDPSIKKKKPPQSDPLSSGMTGSQIGGAEMKERCGRARCQKS